MNLNHLAAWSATLLPTLALAAETPDAMLEQAIARISAEEITGHISTLASDEFEGRMTGTRGEELTVNYIAEAFREAGLAPGADGSWFQEVPLRGTLQTAATPMSLAIGDEHIEWANREHWVAGACSFEPVVEVTDSEVVFVGYGIQAAEYDWDDLKGLDLAGKTVIFLYGDPGQATGDETLFQGRAMSRWGTREAKVERFAELGAAATFWVHDQAAMAYPWSVYGEANPRWSFAIADEGPSSGLKAAGVMPKASVRALFERAGLDFDAALAAAATRTFRPLPLGMQASFRLESELKTVNSRNVLGLLRGSEEPDELVVYTAHWDHEGMDPKAEGDKIFNGAVDNATGTAVLMHLAQRFGELPQRPARSVLFMATTAEERGLLGSHYYADHPVYPLANTVAVINMDALFPFGETKGMTVTALGSSEIEETMALAAQRVGRKLYGDGSPEAGAYYRSDHYPFAAKGVPAVFAVGGPAMEDDVGETVDINRWAEYVGGRYHRPADEYDPVTWDMAGIVQDATIYFETGYRIANAGHRPAWYPGNEFRSLHEALMRTFEQP